jgi:hypothetical protein
MHRYPWENRLIVLLGFVIAVALLFSLQSRGILVHGGSMGRQQKSTGVVQQTYDQHQTLDNPSGSTVQRLISEGTAHTLTASAALSAMGAGGMSEMIDATRSSLIGGAIMSAAHDPHALVHAGSAGLGFACLLTPCAEAVVGAAAIVESGNFLSEQLEKK